MNPEELRSKSTEELNSAVADLSQELFNLKEDGNDERTRK
jgi:ribosomal protein L29